VLGALLLVLLFVFPGGIAGGLVAGFRYLKSRMVSRRA
jgi:hypothetical protein